MFGILEYLHNANAIGDVDDDTFTKKKLRLYPADLQETETIAMSIFAIINIMIISK